MLGICKVHLRPFTRSADKPEHCRSQRSRQLHVKRRTDSKHFGQRHLVRRWFISHITTTCSKRDKSVDMTSSTVEGGMFQSLGNLCFRSKYSDSLWNTSISAPFRVVRVAAMTLISLILLARSWRLFVRYSLGVNLPPVHI